MKITVAHISEEDGLRIHHLYPEGSLGREGDDLRLAGPTEVTAQAIRSGDQVQLTGSVTASASFDCDRCLKPISIRVEPSFDLLYIPPLGTDEEKELAADDLSLGFYQDQTIDLDSVIMEQIELSLPMSRLCKEDCVGLCSTCGANLNDGDCGCKVEPVDPRWAALAQLKDKKR